MKGLEMKKALLVAAVLMLVGCGPEPDTDMTISSPQAKTASAPECRVQVTRIGVIRDELAYYDKRGIYVITDTKTGKEFIGVSGIGITEVGSHSTGKNSRSEDER